MSKTPMWSRDVTLVEYYAAVRSENNLECSIWQIKQRPQPIPNNDSETKHCVEALRLLDKWTYSGELETELMRITNLIERQTKIYEDDFLKKIPALLDMATKKLKLR